MIYLVRHGQTNSNTTNTWQGQSGNDGLNETGQSQASKLAEYLSDKNIQKIFNSPLKRAAETAKIVSEKLNLEIVKDELLMEMNYGEFEGLTMDHISIKYSELYNRWKDDPENTMFPNGESFKDLINRANKILKKYFTTEQNLMLVSHEDMIRAILVAVSGKKSEFWLPEIVNTSITSFESSPGNLKIISIGETPHL